MMESVVPQGIDRRQAVAGAAAITAAMASPLAAQTGSPKTKPEYRSARQLVAALSERKLSSAELVDQAIAQIEARDASSTPSSCATSSALAAPPRRPMLRSRAASVAHCLA